MARRKNNRQTNEAPHRIFRLNPNNPREKVIEDFLASQASNRGASAAIKRALYERITGLDWDTNRPLVATATIASEPAKLRKPTDDEKKKKLIENIMGGFEDWATAYS